MENAVGQPPHELVSQLTFPPGYHFVPTETELLDVYLRRKIEGQALPLSVVNEVAILDWQPGNLVEAYKGYGESKWYFFTVREPSSSNKEKEPNRKVRVPGVKATWKATGSVVPIPAAAKAKQDGEPAAKEEEAEEAIVGTKRVLIYQSSDAEEDGKWSMHEYILKGHAKIGQYALCSIQRKQHSDIMEDTDEGSSRRKGRKRTKETNMDPGKSKKRRTKRPSIQPEGAQLEHQETGPVETPVKPKSKARRTATKRKNKASVQDDEGQRQKQQHQEVALDSPIKPPLTPPKEAPPQPLLQDQMALAAYMTSVQGYPAYPDGMLEASAPTHEGGTIASDFQYDDMLRDHEEQPLSFTDSEFIADAHAQYQFNQQQDYYSDFGQHQNQHLYTEQQHFLGNTAQNYNSTWDHGQHQIYQQEIGGVFGAPNQHTDDQCYDLGETGHYSSDQFTGSVQGVSSASGSDGYMDLDDAGIFDVLCDYDPQDRVGTQDGCNPEALQSQDEPQWSCAQQQHTAGGHGCDEPTPRCVSEFWERY
ncbi:unnamed protein product [Urochloa decumbens]|uniref:NAC domain-containing protein n=1 Tax=Urochloa decumbens TaxID=240449 RepID=A0ABC8W2F8_9POAL